jgi:hypothetical protein
MASQGDSSVMFQLAVVERGVDEDVYSMCQAFGEVATEKEAVIPSSHIDEPGAILKTIQRLKERIELTQGAWAPDMKRLALGALVMYKKRFATDVSMHDHVELLHALCGDKWIKAHGGSSYTVRDGAWRRHKGVASEGLLYTTKESLLGLEGLLILLAEGLSNAASDTVLLNDIHAIYTADGLGVSVEELMGRIKDKARYQVKPDVHVAPNKFIYIADRVKKWSASMQSELLAKTLYEMYGAWCSIPKKATPGICFTDCCLRFTSVGIEYIQKSSENNIYTYVDTPLKDPVLQAHMERLMKIHAATYWQNKAAFTSELCAMCLALRGRNIDRGFFHIGKGGAGQSLTTAHFHALLCGLHAYLDMNIYYSDDELRKQGELLIDMIVGTGQESVQGSTSALRFDLLKKHLSGDPIAMRLLYSIVTKMEPLVGWKRYECNLLPTFVGVTEHNFNSVMRRGWVMSLQATLVEPSVYGSMEDPESKGFFIKDPAARDFVISDPAKAAGWKIMHGVMASFSESRCYQEIEDYVDGHDKGLTRKCLRYACGLPQVAPASAELSGPIDPVEEGRNQMQRESDALVGFCLDNDLEYMTDGICRQAVCLSGSNPTKRKESFHKLIGHGFWKASVKTANHSTQNYVPMLKTLHGLSAVCPQGPIVGPPSLPEEIDLGALREEHNNVHRRHNVVVRVKQLEAFKTFLAGGRGARSKEDKWAMDETTSAIGKLQFQEAHLKRVIEQGEDNVELRTRYGTKYPRMSRMRAESGGIQGMSNVTQARANPELDEWDQVSAQWTFLAQIADRVQLQLDHRCALFSNIRRYAEHKDEILAAISPDCMEAKGICLQVLNGMAIPILHTNNEFLRGVRLEARLMRWLACSLDPTFHTHLIEEGVKTWPEATVLFYLWTGAEAWCTLEMCTLCLSLSPRHLSLHYDGVKIERGSYQGPVDAFKKQLEDVVLQATGYRIGIAQKSKLDACELFRHMMRNMRRNACNMHGGRQHAAHDAQHAAQRAQHARRQATCGT